MSETTKPETFKWRRTSRPDTVALTCHTKTGELVGLFTQTGRDQWRAILPDGTKVPGLAGENRTQLARRVSA